ncbi:MAG: carboxymuconolactone decarboxylase family protein [Gammaproteobacteria bacterium]|nr:carboxymuconolactone decarboxylase family protein [Gammaproteobacteria bacterium]NIR85619.1 carboxymuconolactone decarboxylase family protein [Gammaproteobacteria bacterium]NIR90107.1 carboxymuconolactone decarboxylase family protein [Gammaproteobacteria bacterium]NIU06753.1 carboxymuconolactone decarboxylase family protein [Gammaproteobacteria bacterium]NIV53686.1 hypothetical protein [Gammaproteobacteria bacterium]
MDRKTIELIALGASAAVNCRPCMDHHLAEGRRLGLSDKQLCSALEVGVRVNQGAGEKTVEYITEHLGQRLAAERRGGCCG